MITKQNVKIEAEKIIEWIRNTVNEAEAKGIVIGNSGGVDSATVIALVTKAIGAENVIGVMMPCLSLDKDEIYGRMVAEKFFINSLRIDLSDTFVKLKDAININLKENELLKGLSLSNIKPRLRMTTLYSIGQMKGYLIAGTGNKSERIMGYFTKWGDGACDFNPLAELTKGEVFILGEYLGVPEEILTKVPSAGLWEGQSDENEMGVTYKEIDEYIIEGNTNDKAKSIIENHYDRTKHKREAIKTYKY